MVGFRIFGYKSYIQIIILDHVIKSIFEFAQKLSNILKNYICNYGVHKLCIIISKKMNKYEIDTKRKYFFLNVDLNIFQNNYTALVNAIIVYAIIVSSNSVLAFR